MAPKKSATKSAAAAVAGKRGRKRAPEGETREQKFVRLGQYRMTKCLASLGQVKRLARYPHSPEQGAKIVEALRAAIDTIEVSFSETTSSAERPSFRF